MSLVKLEQGNRAQKTQEVYYVTENVPLREEVWEHEEVVEEHAKVSYEDKLAPLGKTVVLLSEVNVLSSPEKTSQRDQKPELRGEISVTDTATRTETRLTKYKIVPKREEAVAAVEESEPAEEKTEEAFVRTIDSQTEEITHERRDSTSVILLPDKKADSEQETSVTVKSERELTIKTESTGRQVREQQGRKPEDSSRGRESVQDITAVSDTDQTKAPLVIINTRARKQTETVENEREGVADGSTDRVTNLISGSRTEPKTKSKEFTVHDKTNKVVLTQEEMVDTHRIDETQIKPLVISDFREEETSAPGKVFVKKHEVAERLTSHDTTDTKKEKVPDLEVSPKVKPKESVTDIKLQKPKMMQQKSESKSGDAQTEGVYKKREEAMHVPPQRGDAEQNETLTKDTIQTKSPVTSKPAEKKRTSSRGTESLLFFIQPAGGLISTSVFMFHHLSIPLFSKWALFYPLSPLKYGNLVLH